MELVQDIVEALKDFALNNNIILSLLIGFFLIVLESIIPILPLAVFIALNLIIFGNITGFVLSWVATIIGCTLSFYIFRKGLSKKLYKHIDNTRVMKIINIIDDISFSKLVIIMAIPFTPAFAINISAGLSKMKYKKFLMAAIIAKLSTVYFWGFVGTTLFESITDITVIIKLIVILIIAFFLSKIVINKFDVD